MRSLVPRLSYEAPPEYVAFVARHLADLRRDAEQVCEQDADHFCTQVLTDVAQRWRWLELLRNGFGMRRAGESYLRTALQRRSQHHFLEEGDLVPVQVWSEDERAPERRSAPPVPPRSSAALRMAPMIRPEPRHEAVPVIEAAIAWLHAMETHRRRRYLAFGAFVFALVVVFARLNATFS